MILHPLTSKGGAFVLKLGLVFKVGKHRKVPAGFFHTPQHIPVAQSHIPQGALIFASIFLNFYNGRKWHTVNVERTAFIGYTTNIAILQKLLGRYCKPSHAKKRDGSFFVHIHHVAFLDKCQRALLCCPMVLWSLTLIVMPRSASSM